jgi:hypothetical protein
MPLPTPTKMSDALAGVGLDPTHLPSLDALDDRQQQAVMQTFTQALGMSCDGCHEDNRAIPTRRTRIAGKMWDVMVRGLRFGDGSAIYCDSCHDGAATFLVRGDTSPDGQLGQWMRAAYVDPLARSDGNANGCATCHGAPYVGKFLGAWGEGPPDLGGPGSSDDGGTEGVAGDMARAGCGKLLGCIDACGSDTRCAGECKSHAPAPAKQILAAAQDCSQSECKQAGRCKSASDDSDDCNRCYSNSSAGPGTGETCMPVGDPECGRCAAEWLACEDD